MPRSGRLVLPDWPHHVIQRGHNRQPVFTDDDDFAYYLDNLRDEKHNLGCRIHAFCLMTNHVHLVIDPGPAPDNLGRLMKRVAARQTRYVNKLERRTGTLWESRFKSSPVQTDSYLLACCRYVEMNPVRAGIVADPANYRWSSHATRIGGGRFDWLDPDPAWLALGETDDQRQAGYRRFIHDTVPEHEWKLIAESVQRGQLTGSRRFAEEVAERLQRRIDLRGPGRPRTREQANGD
ncbi:MAG: REP-associated tyrosine transposase [Desulfuromonadales bacterium]